MTVKVRVSTSRCADAPEPLTASTRSRWIPGESVGSGTSADVNAAACTTTGASGSVSDETVKVTVSPAARPPP